MVAGFTRYPNFREVADERFADMDDNEIVAIFNEEFGENIDPANYEDLFAGLAKGINRFAKVATPVAQGFAKGATAGSVAGPWGALAGGVLGGAGSALQKHGRGSARNVGNVLGGVVGSAGALGGRNTTGVLGALGQRGAARPAIGALLGVLGRPETATALRALTAGQNPSIPVGPAKTPVAANAFAGLLGALAREAEAEADNGLTSMPTYLLDAEGQPVVDPSIPEDRAARLLELLTEASQNEDSVEMDNLDESYPIDADSDEMWSDLVDDAEGTYPHDMPSWNQS